MATENKLSEAFIFTMRRTITETERLTIRKFTPADAEFMLRLLNTPQWIRMIGNRRIYNAQAARTYIRQFILEDYHNLGYGFYLVELKKEHLPIGLCGFTKRPSAIHPDLGFALLPEYEGNGYMYEAATSLLEYAHTQLSLKQVDAYTSVANTACQKLLDKLAFHFKEERFEAVFQAWIRYYQKEV